MKCKVFKVKVISFIPIYNNFEKKIIKGERKVTLKETLSLISKKYT